MTFSAHIAGKHPMKRKRLPKNTIPWPCDCYVTSRTDGNLEEKLNPGYLVRCIDCGAERP